MHVEWIGKTYKKGYQAEEEISCSLIITGRKHPERFSDEKKEQFEKSLNQINSELLQLNKNIEDRVKEIHKKLDSGM